MAAVASRFHLAALVHSVGRARAARLLAQTRDPVAALARAPARLEPRQLSLSCARGGIRLLLPGDDAFPPLLCGIPDPPPLLYALGETRILLRPAVAVVGARRCSRAGFDVAAALAADLAARGIVVVSGLARGIDAAAHRAAVDAGHTIAVIGSGLARPYPAVHRGLVQAILDGGGLLLSEYPPDAGARRHYFPERNRLISGLSRGVVVVEAGEQSGSLITARLALEQGRDVCAVPGNVGNPASRGCHRLLRQGAALVESADDVVEALGLVPVAGAVLDAGGRESPDLEAGLAEVLGSVDTTLTTLDQIVAGTRLTTMAASAALLELELGGFVRQVPGGYIRRPLH